MTEGIDFGQVQHPHPAAVNFALEQLGLGVNPRNPPLGTPLRGAALREALRVQRISHETSEVPGRLWSAPPPIDPRRGDHYPSAIISCPLVAQDGSRASPGPSSASGLTKAGGIVVIKCGSGSGGEFSRRVAVAGGRAVVGQFGRFANVTVVTERVNDTPVAFSWVRESSMASGADDTWESPPYAYAGGNASIIVPEGAVEVLSDTTTILTFTVLTSGTARTFAVAVTAGVSAVIPSTSSSFAGADACVLLFRLAPL